MSNDIEQQARTLLKDLAKSLSHCHYGCDSHQPSKHFDFINPVKAHIVHYFLFRDHYILRSFYWRKSDQKLLKSMKKILKVAMKERFVTFGFGMSSINPWFAIENSVTLRGIQQYPDNLGYLYKFGRIGTFDFNSAKQGIHYVLNGYGISPSTLGTYSLEKAVTC